MSKVICDICGTSYPETSAKCPICGYAKTSSETTAASSDRTSGEGGYTSVKGGHFSKKNVRKRTGSTASERARRSQPEEGNTGLILVVIFLLVAIVAVVIYIGLRVFKSPDAELPQPTATVQVTQPTETTPTDTTNPTDSVDPTAPTETIDATNPTDATEDNSVPCESLQLSNQTIEFVNAGDTWTIQVRPTPANTTQRVIFTSSDANVVSVDENGLLMAVGSGTATITVTCGTITQTCEIKCSFETPSVPPTTPTTDPTAPTGATTDATTDPTTQTPTDPTATGTTATNPTVPTVVVPTGPVDPSFTFEFNTKFQDATSGKWDTTLDELGETWRAYKKDLSVDPGAITWTTDDPSVCTIQNGIVTGVGPGKTEVHAQYGGQTFSCIIRCTFAAGEIGNTVATTPTTPITSTTPTEPENNGNVTGPYTISSEDMTIAVGEFWWLRLKDKDGNTIENVVWKAEDSSIVRIEGNKIYGEKTGKTTVSTTYEGVTYTCIVRIKAAN